MNPDRPRHLSTSLLLFSLAAVLFSLSSAVLAADTEKLVVISNDEVVGTLEATQDGQSVQLAYAVDNNGRGPKVKETITLNEQGFPLSWQVTGSSLFGAAVEENYHWQAGTATWRSQADSGSVAAAEPGMYIGGDSSPWAVGMYVRALLGDADQQLDVLPSGRMKLQVLETLAMGEAALPVTIYELSGIELDPQLLALDADKKLFAAFSGRSGLIRAGFENVLPQLQQWAQGHELRRLQQIQSQLAHNYTAPIRFRNVRVFDSVERKLGEPASVMVKDGRIVAIEAADAAGDPQQ
ncbi:MAG TPA: hypothetical protein VJN01_11300, partial [Xanthomonadales bacterium]|nr:hypothetical protein [Xanthomonadales bacterium]